MEQDFEKFLNQTKNKNQINDPKIDAELDELMKDDEDYNRSKKKKISNDDSINLSDLENEDEKNGADPDDDELNQLENEEDNLGKEVKDKLKKTDIKITEPVNKEVIPDKIIIDEEKKNIIDEDIFLEDVEKLYHRTDKMKSIGVLQDEQNTIEEIIKYKKDKGYDYDYFESKKDLVEIEIDKLQNLCVCGAMDIETYKKIISSQLKYEDQLIEYANKDKKITKAQLNKVIERINKRKEIINNELTQEVQEEEEEENPNVEENPTVEEHKTVEQPIEVDKHAVENIEEKKSIEHEPRISKPVEIINKELYEEIKKRVFEYKEAIDYFKKIGSADQETDATAKARELVKALKEIELGKDVDEFSLPIGINPDYICGYSKQDRLNHYSNIIKEFSKRKNELNQTLQIKIDKMKTMDKKDFAKIKDAAKKDLDNTKSKIDFYNKLIAKLTDAAKNPWVPAPLYSYVEEEDKVEKINDSIQAQTLKIHIGDTTYDKDCYLYVTLNLGEKVLNEYVYIKKNKSFDTEIIWKLEKLEFKSLPRKVLEIQFYRTHWYWPFKSQLKGSTKVKLDSLKSKSQIKDSFNIELESKRYVPNLDITINLREPVIEKEYDIISKPVFTITKTFPPFRGEGSGETHSYPAEKKPIIKDEEIKIQPKPIPKKIEEKKEPPKKPATNQPIIDASEFTKEELEDPDIPDNLNSIRVMEMKLEQVKKQIDSIEGRAPMKLRDKYLKLKCRKKVLEEQLGESITVESYILMIKKQLDKDKRLLMYFEQNKMIEQGKKVSERIPIMIKEIEEAIEFAKNKK